MLGGWVIGYYGSLGVVGPAAIQAFIAGGVLLTVFSEEIPKEPEGRQGTFAAAALLFGTLSVSVRRPSAAASNKTAASISIES